VTKNMGIADRVIRIVLALVVVGLFFSGRIGGTIAIVLLVIAGLFLVTSLVGRCPGYLPFGISTRGRSAGGASSGGGAS
jgi:K+-transporting ATPase A subunit